DMLEIGYFESVLALLSAPVSGRDRLLHLAGASAYLETVRDELSTVTLDSQETEKSDTPEVIPTPRDNASEGAIESVPRSWERQTGPIQHTPLFRPEDLM